MIPFQKKHYGICNSDLIMCLLPNYVQIRFFFIKSLVQIKSLRDDGSETNNLRKRSTEKKLKLAVLKLIKSSDQAHMPLKSLICAKMWIHCHFLSHCNNLLRQRGKIFTFLNEARLLSCICRWDAERDIVCFLNDPGGYGTKMSSGRTQKMSAALSQRIQLSPSDTGQPLTQMKAVTEADRSSTTIRCFISD